MPTTIRTASNETRVNTYTNSDQGVPIIAALIGGGYVVTWMSEGQDGEVTGVYAQRYDAAGIAQGAEFRVNTTTAYTQGRNAVAPLSDGGFVVTWSSYNNQVPLGVFAQRYSANGTPQGTEFLVSSGVSQTPHSSVAGLSNGGFAVTWNNSGDGNSEGVSARIYNASGTAIGAAINVNTYTTGWQHEPAIAALSDGSFIVSWVSFAQDGSAGGIYATRVSATGVIGNDGNAATRDGEFRVNTTTANEQSFPRVATLSNGSFVVAWSSWNQDGSGGGVYAQRFDAGGFAVGSEFRVNTFTSGDQSGNSGIGSDNSGRVGITALADGGFVVTWQSSNQSSSIYDIYAQRYAANGTAVGGEFRVNQTLTDYQLLPTVAGLAGGGLVFTWMSTFGQDGSGSGIYQRIYAASTALTTTANTVEGLTTGDDVILTLNNGLSTGDVIDGLGGTDTIRLSQAGTLDARNGTLTSIERFEGSSGNDTIYGTANGETLQGGAGNDTLTGGAGADIFLLGAGAETITDFSPTEANERIDLRLVTNVANFTQLSALAVPNGADLTFDFGSGNTLRLNNTTLSQLSADDFVFVVPQVRTVGNETLVNTYTPGRQNMTNIAASGNGGYVVVWASFQQDGSGYGVYGQRFAADGTKVGSEFQINTSTTNDQLLPVATYLADGSFVVSWLNLTSSSSVQSVQARRFSADGTPLGGEFQVNTSGVTNEFYQNDGHAPSITALSSGHFVVTWVANNRDGSGDGVFMQRFEVNGTPVGSETRVNTYTTSGQQMPTIASLGDGGFVVSWNSWGQDGSDNGVFAQRFDAAGIPLSTEFRVNSTTANSQAQPAVIGLESGGFVVTWMSYQQDGSSEGIYAQLYAANGSALGGEFRVNTHVANRQWVPSVASLADGGFVVTWSSGWQDGSEDGVYGQRFNSLGQRVGSEFRVNQTTAGYQLRSSVANLDGNSFAIVWMSEFQSGSGFAIYQRLFNSTDLTALTTIAENVTGTTSDDIILSLDNGLSTGDIIDGLDGTDAIRLSEAGTLDARNGTLTSIERLEGSLGNDTIYGTAGGEIIDGREGADILVGGNGNDTYFVDNAGDTITENANEGTDTVQSSVTYTLSANIENLTLTGSGNINGTGNGLANTIAGNAGNNALDGAGGTDTLIGGAGNDIYVVDHIYDVVIENANEGTDTVEASRSYTLGANVENLTLTGNDVIDGTGNAASNVIRGNANLNYLDGREGADTLIGGAGDDTYVVDNVGDLVVEQQGEGTIDAVITSISYALAANVEQLRLSGSASINGTGNALDNLVRGNSGNNILDGGAGVDLMFGGAGNDTYIVDQLPDMISESANEGTDTVETALVAYSLVDTIHVENLTGTSSFGQTLTGNASANTLRGGIGADVLDGGAGVDTLIGGAGNDIYIVDNAGDIVTEMSGNGTSDTIRTTLQGYTLTSSAHIERLEGLSDNGQTLTGNGLDNTIASGAGNDTLDGGTGSDTLIGGLGDDTYLIDHAGDIITELSGQGTDTVRAAFNHTLGANLENLVLTGAANLAGTGNTLANTLTGNFGANILDGGAGNDTLAGGAGDDTFVYGVNSGADIVTDFTVAGGIDRIDLQAFTAIWSITQLLGIATQTGADTVLNFGAGNTLTLRNVAHTALVEDDFLFAPGPTARANGTAGNDEILGTGANDTLDGLAGNDRINGGSGDDRIIYDAADTPSGILGGVGIDTLVITNGAGLPTSFNLASQGFERAERGYADAGTSYPWSSLVETYDTNWQLLQEDRRNDDGSRRLTSFDTAGMQVWASAVQEFNTADQRLVQRSYNDNGSYEFYYWDPLNTQGWDNLLESFNAAGQRTLQRIYNDNGSYRFFYWDLAGVENWTTFDEEFNAAGGRHTQRISYDNGDQRYFYWDVTNSQSWDQFDDQYNGLSQRTQQTIVNDDGTISQQYWDVAATQNYSTYVDYFNAARQRVEQRIFHDQGSNNGGYTRAFTDADSSQPWLTRTDVYNAAGQLVSRTDVPG